MQKGQSGNYSVDFTICTFALYIEQCKLGFYKVTKSPSWPLVSMFYIFQKLFQEFLKLITGRYENKEHILTFLCAILNHLRMRHFLNIMNIGVCVCVHTYVHMYIHMYTNICKLLCARYSTYGLLF